MNAAHFLNYYNFQTYLAAIWFNTHWLTSHPLQLLQNISMWNAQWLGGMLAINRVNDKKVNLSKKTESHGVLLGYYIPLFSERSSICFCIFPFPACLDSGRVMAQLFFQSLFSLQFASTSLWLVFWFQTKKIKKKLVRSFLSVFLQQSFVCLVMRGFC